jgi:hypothetical protein
MQYPPRRRSEHDVIASARGFGTTIVGNTRSVKELPEDLASMDPAELSLQREFREHRLVPLFRRWPALDRVEMRRLKQLYRETVRIAKHLGQRRGRSW